MKILIFIPLLFGQILFVSASWGSDFSTRACVEIRSAKSTNDKSGLSVSFWDSMMFRLNKSANIGVAQFENGRLGFLADPSTDNPWGFQLGNQIRIYAPGTEDFPTRAEENEFSVLKSKFRSEYQNYIQPLIAAPSVVACAKTADDIGFGEVISKQINNDVTRLVELRSKIFEKQSNSLIFQTSKTFKQVNVSQFSNYQDILKNLKSIVEKTDIVLVMHGSLDGSLEDLSGLVVPPFFFDEISRIRGVQNIIIYACYPTQVAQFYKEPMERLTQAGAQIFFSMNEKHLKSLEAVDLSLFPYFLDKYIHVELNSW